MALATEEAVSSSQNTLPVCLWKENPYRLVSLLEIVKKFSAALFSSLAANLGILSVTLTGDARPVSDAEKVSSVRILTDFLNDCISLGLTTSAISTRRMLQAYSKDDCRFGEIRHLAEELQERLIDEMTGTLFLSLDIGEAEHYNKPRKGWQEVLDRFPNATTDVEEARKCLALGRYTAAVFHLMRVTEAAVLELQCFLDTKSDAKAHFGSVLQKLEHLKQKTEFKDLPDHLKRYVGFLSDVLPQLHAIRDSWRNKVSHVDDRIIIADVFTEEMASGIYDATQLLMKKLASGLPKPVP